MLGFWICDWLFYSVPFLSCSNCPRRASNILHLSWNCCTLAHSIHGNSLQYPPLHYHFYSLYEQSPSIEERFSIPTKIQTKSFLSSSCMTRRNYFQFQLKYHYSFLAKVLPLCLLSSQIFPPAQWACPTLSPPGVCLLLPPKSLSWAAIVQIHFALRLLLPLLSGSQPEGVQLHYGNGHQLTVCTRTGKG